jgi:GT2 family glycosyltransferase
MSTVPPPIRPVVTLPAPSRPRASVLILAWRNVEPLARCLTALARTLPPELAEVVILLNGACSAVVEFVTQHVSGARVVHSDVNLGFAGGCNRAAASARGDYLVFLNDDTEADPDWLTTLVDAADAIPSAGAIGSCILFPDASLQEAGCLIWSDGSTMQVGRRASADANVYAYRRRVDYCSACSLLVRRSVWALVGGMDTRYYPAYYEDVDLCLAIQEAGYEVVYEPKSRLRHLESASTTDRFRHHVFTRNKERFQEKWRTRLSQFPTPRPTSAVAVSHAIRRSHGRLNRLLVIDDLVPNPAEGSGFSRMDQALRQLSASRYSVAFHASAVAAVRNEKLADLGIEAIGHPLDAHLSRPDVSYDAVLVSRPHNYRRYAAHVRRLQPQAALIYDAEALFCRRVARYQRLFGGGPESFSEAERLEADIARRADRLVCISPTEARWFRRQGARRVEVIAPFWPAIGITPDDAERADLLFVAGWLAGATSPNGDGLMWFLDEIWPRIRAVLPQTVLNITGDAPPEVRSLPAHGVRFLGIVPSLAPLYARARVVVAPVRYGAGVKIKVVEALQHGVPVVTTSIGAEGISLPAHDAIRVADRPQRFAEKVAELLVHEDVWARYRERALALERGWRQRHVAVGWRVAVDRAILERRPAAVRSRVRDGRRQSTQ